MRCHRERGRALELTREMEETVFGGSDPAAIFLT